MEKHIPKIQSVHLQPSSPLRLLVWKMRRGLRELTGHDILDTQANGRPARSNLREIYRRLDDFIVRISPDIQKLTPRKVALKRIRDVLEHDLCYDFAEVDEEKPWGAYYRIADHQATRFLNAFFPDLSETEAKLGRKDVVLSPKIMLVFPGQRLSWQYHDRRAECWHFLTSGIHYRAHSDKQGEPIRAPQGTVVQFATGERHRLEADKESYAVVAEIWQHTDPDAPSDEADIVRLQDDYKR